MSTETMNKAKDLRDQTMHELSVRHSDLCKELFSLRNERQLSKTNKTPHLTRVVKKNIARVLTVLSEKQIGMNA